MLRSPLVLTSAHVVAVTERTQVECLMTVAAMLEQREEETGALPIIISIGSNIDEADYEGVTLIVTFDGWNWTDDQAGEVTHAGSSAEAV